MQSGGSATIQAQELITDRLYINSSFTVASGGKGTSGRTIIDSGTLTNKGEFVSNGPFVKKENGTFINKGTISGNGSLPDDAKQTPDQITGYTAEISRDYSENIAVFSTAFIVIMFLSQNNIIPDIGCKSTTLSQNSKGIRTENHKIPIVLRRFITKFHAFLSSLSHYSLFVILF